MPPLASGDKGRLPGKAPREPEDFALEKIQIVAFDTTDKNALSSR